MTVRVKIRNNQTNPDNFWKEFGLRTVHPLSKVENVNTLRAFWKALPITVEYLGFTAEGLKTPSADESTGEGCGRLI
jgi:hypothetical protein